MSLARSMANEWSEYGIRANCVAPDIIATPRVVAGPLVFLLSDLSSFMTGQTLVVDGGTQALFPHRSNSFDEPDEN